MNAADLFLSGSTEFVAATPGNAMGEYQGCLVFPIVDVVAGAVPRDSNGVAIAARAIAPQPGRFAGACAMTPIASSRAPGRNHGCPTGVGRPQQRGVRAAEERRPMR
jgi:hypothetical protein